MAAEKFFLKWDGFQDSLTSVFDRLRQDSELVDVTLCCKGQRVRAHRMMLAACSPYFRELFKDLPCQQLVVFLHDTSAAVLTALVEFMYKGSVTVAPSQLASFIKTAEMLQVQGLSGGDDQDPRPSPAPPLLPEPGRGWTWSQQQQQQDGPAAGLRRAPDAAELLPEPRRKRRRAEPLPTERRASPPPPAPAAAAAPVPEVLAAVNVPRPEEETPPEPAAGQCESVVKVEQYDVVLLTRDDREGGGGEDVEPALCHSAHYEDCDPGSDQSHSADGQLLAAAGDAETPSDDEAGPGGPYSLGPSQRTEEDTSQCTEEDTSQVEPFYLKLNRTMLKVRDEPHDPIATHSSYTADAPASATPGLTISKEPADKDRAEKPAPPKKKGTVGRPPKRKSWGCCAPKPQSTSKQ